MEPVGTSVVLTTARVRSGSARLMFLVAETRSKTSMASAPPSMTRLDAVMSALLSVLVMRRFETTVPPFWARPVWSRPFANLPSNSAAVEMIWLTVTTPVPPMPMSKTLPSAGTDGSAGTSPAGTPARSLLGRKSGSISTVTNAGQLPPRQVRSKLQDSW